MTTPIQEAFTWIWKTFGETAVKGTTLFIDCLKLAAVSNRAGIEERLLLPAASPERP